MSRVVCSDPAQASQSRMPKTKQVIVDTNCYVRLYQSPVRPILGSEFGGYRLVTLKVLRLECKPGSRVYELYPQMRQEDVQRELEEACLKLREPKTSKVTSASKVALNFGNRHLAAYCASKKMELVRKISGADAQAYAAADVLQGALATDEWPLRMACANLNPELELLDTVGILHRMEASGAITSEQRRTTLRMVVLNDEDVPSCWAESHQRLFSEPMPDGQAPRSQSA